MERYNCLEAVEEELCGLGMHGVSFLGEAYFEESQCSAHFSMSGLQTETAHLTSAGEVGAGMGRVRGKVLKCTSAASIPNSVSRRASRSHLRPPAAADPKNVEKGMRPGKSVNHSPLAGCRIHCRRTAHH